MTDLIDISVSPALTPSSDLEVKRDIIQDICIQLETEEQRSMFTNLASTLCASKAINPLHLYTLADYVRFYHLEKTPVNTRICITLSDSIQKALTSEQSLKRALEGEVIELLRVVLKDEESFIRAKSLLGGFSG